MCRHCDTVICSVMLCEWLLYCSCVVSVKHLCVTQYYVSVYDSVRVSYIQELLEEEKQFQTTIDELTKTEKSYIRTVHEVSKLQKQL